MVFGSQSPCRLVWIRKHRPGRREGHCAQCNSVVSKSPDWEIRNILSALYPDGPEDLSQPAQFASCSVLARRRLIDRIKSHAWLPATEQHQANKRLPARRRHRGDTGPPASRLSPTMVHCPGREGWGRIPDILTRSRAAVKAALSNG